MDKKELIEHARERQYALSAEVFVYEQIRSVNLLH